MDPTVIERHVADARESLDAAENAFILEHAELAATHRLCKYPLSHTRLGPKCVIEQRLAWIPNHLIDEGQPIAWEVVKTLFPHVTIRVIQHLDGHSTPTTANPS